jgi:predicted nucleic acid-binding protein
MPIVVADTGPLNYLVLIKAIDLLPKLFDLVCVPETVFGELTHQARLLELARDLKDHLILAIGPLNPGARTRAPVDHNAPF